MAFDLQYADTPGFSQQFAATGAANDHFFIIFHFGVS
jgi:hypothetical protein